MSTDTELRDFLETRAEQHTISVSSLQDITAAGEHSIRRARLTGSFCFIALVMVGLFGYAGLRSPDAPTTMFAGLQEDVSGSPATIIATEDGWLGAVLVSDDPQSTTDWAGEIYLAASDDGESWELADPTGLTSTSSELAIAEHNGRYWLALTEDDQVYVAFTDDLKTWTRIDIPEANEFESEVGEGMRRVVSANKVVANDAGVMAMIQSWPQPDFEALLDIDHSQVCGLRWTPANFSGPASIGIRPCGGSTWESYEVENVDLGVAHPETNLVLSTDGENFEVIDRPHSDRVVLPFSEVQHLYSTGTGFGIADYGLLESDDGIDWTTIDLNRFSSPVVAAARGDERITAVQHHSDTIRLQYTADGITWETYKLDDVLDLQTSDGNRSFTIRALEASEAGWAISGSLIDFDSVTGEFVDEPDDVTLQLDDVRLRGTMPGGPADLVDSEGEVLASWDNFELAQTSQNEHIEIVDEKLTIFDSNGEAVLETTAKTFADELQLSTSVQVHVVLFSTDGTEWTELHRGLDYISTMAIGDDEVVIAHHSANGPTSIRLPIEPVEAE